MWCHLGLVRCMCKACNAVQYQTWTGCAGRRRAVWCCASRAIHRSAALLWCSEAGILCLCSAGTYFEAVTSTHVTGKPETLLGIQFTTKGAVFSFLSTHVLEHRLTWRQSCLCALLSVLIAYSGVKSNPTNKPCVLHQCLLCLGQGNDDMLSPSQLQCSKRHRQTPEEDAAVSGAAAAPQQAAAMPPTLQLGKLTGQHMHTHCSGHYLPICALHCPIGSLLGRSI